MVSQLRENAKKTAEPTRIRQLTENSLSSRLGEPRGGVKTKQLHPTAKVEHLGDERVKILKFTSEGRV
jgi:hypothetical protein